MTIDYLVDYLVQQGKVKDRQEFKEKVETKIHEIMRLVFVTVKEKLDRRFGCFELFGFDLMIDDQLNP